METIRQDLWYGLRALAKKPGFTAVAVLSLAIGIGANSAIFSVTNALLLRPLPYKDAERLAILWNRSPGLGVAQDWFSPAQYWDVKTQNRVFEQTAVTIGGSFNLTGTGNPEHVDGARVSSSLFPLLGANALHGRVFSAEEDTPGKAQSVILSYGFWQRRFSSDANVIGKTLALNGNNFSIVGVMPRGFSLTKEVMLTVNAIERADVLLPLPMGENARTNRGNEDFNIFAKLKPGVTVAQAQADMDLLTARLRQDFPANYPPNGGLTFSVVPLLQEVVGDISRSLMILFGAVGFVLLIACANVANLLLARAAVRQKEIAIRAAMGASRARLIRQMLTESTVLAGLGGVVGVLFAFGAVKAMRVFGPENIPRLDEISIDARVLAFTCATALLTGILFGLVPALRTSKVDLNDVLKEGGRGTAGVKHQKTRKVLVVAEVALSLILLVGAGLLIRSYRHIWNASPGFNPNNLLSLRLILPAYKHGTPEAVGNFYRQAQEKIRALAGVEAVSVSYSLPMSAVAFAWEPITVEGYVAKGGEASIISNTRIVGADYFRTMQIPLVRGRLFNEFDKKGSQEIAIVSASTAERFWPNQDPIGKRLKRGNSENRLTVAGVINDAKQFSVEKEPPVTVYYAHEQYQARNMFMLIRAKSDPAQLTAAVTREIQSLDNELPVFDVKTMDDRLYESLARRRFSMLLLGVFAVIAAILAAIGIYGVMAYSVNQRTHEIGIRLALGARPANIQTLVLRQSLTLVSAGIVIGLAGAFALTRAMAGLLFGVSATDVPTFVLTAFLLGCVAMLASYLPARRAAKVDPMIALRYE